MAVRTREQALRAHCLQRMVPRCLTSQSTRKWKKNKDAGSHPRLTSLVFLGMRLRILALLTSFTRNSKWHCLNTTKSSVNTSFQKAIQVKDRLNLPIPVLSWGQYTEGVELRRKMLSLGVTQQNFRRGLLCLLTTKQTILQQKRIQRFFRCSCNKVLSSAHEKEEEILY